MKKVCPQGQHWADIHRALVKYSREVVCNPPSPPKPLILAGWAYSSDRDKEERWKETVAWACSNGCSAYIDGLSDEQLYFTHR